MLYPAIKAPGSVVSHLGLEMSEIGGRTGGTVRAVTPDAGQRKSFSKLQKSPPDKETWASCAGL